MAEKNILQKRFDNFLGLDLKSTDLLRPIQFASSILNSQYSKIGSIIKREGYQTRGDTEGGLGLFTYARINPTTNKEENLVLTASDQLFKRSDVTLTVKYTGIIGSDLTEAGSTDTVINATAHIAKAGDTITYTSGVLSGESETVLSVTVNTITTDPFSGAPGVGDSFDIVRLKQDVNVEHFYDTTISAFRFRILEVSQNIIASDLTEAGSTDTIINATAHSALVGDIIEYTSGVLIGETATVSNITANTITTDAFSGSPGTGDGFDILRTEEVAVVDENLGDGRTTIVSVDTLHAAIISVAAYATSTKSGVTATAAAFLGIARPVNIVSEGDQTFTAFSWTLIDSPLFNGDATNPFANGNASAKKNDEDFELMSSIQINNVLYLSNGFDEVQKYDGQNVYRAGLPEPDDISVATPPGATGIPAGTYRWVIQYIQKDKVGNIAESTPSNTFISTDFILNDVGEVTIPIIKKDSGFNTNAAISDDPGSTENVTTNQLDVDDGSSGAHTLQVGDTAYFFDSNSVPPQYVEREVTARTASTIDVAGDPVTVADNAVISNNLRIAIFRTKVGGTAPFLVEEIPNDPFATGPPTIVYSDTTLDGDLGAEFVRPFFTRPPPRKNRYISSFRNQMMLAGDPEFQNRLYFSDVLNPEYHPPGNSLDVGGIAQDKIKGISPNNEVFLTLKDHSYAVLSGDIANRNVRLDTVSHDIGLTSHHSLKEIRGALYYLSNEGPRFMVGGQLPKPLGGAVDDPTQNSSRIDPLFDQRGTPSVEQLILKRAIAVNDRLGEKYILYIPVEGIQGGTERIPQSSSVILAYDYSRDAWLKWDSLNMYGGLAEVNGEIFFQERTFPAATQEHYLHKIGSLGDAYDYQDHTNPIIMSYKSQWEFLGEPSVFKKFLELKLFSLESIRNNNFNVCIQTELNFLDESIEADFEVDFTATGYGETPYGSSYGDPNEGIRTKKIGPNKVRSLRIVFRHEGDQATPVVSAWEFNLTPPYLKKFKAAG